MELPLTPPPPAFAPAGVGCRGRVLSGVREAMPCCSGESPARWCWGKGERSRQSPGKGGRSAASRGMGVPRGLLEHPCGASLLLKHPPLGVSPCPDKCAGLGRRLLLATATARQPEPPQSPCCHRHARAWADQPMQQWHRVPRPGGSRGVTAQSCTSQLDLTGLWGLLRCRPVSLKGSEKAVGVPPALVEWDMAHAVSHWGFPSPRGAPPSVLLGG